MLIIFRELYEERSCQSMLIRGFFLNINFNSICNSTVHLKTYLVYPLYSYPHIVRCDLCSHKTDVNQIKSLEEPVVPFNYVNFCLNLCILLNFDQFNVIYHDQIIIVLKCFFGKTFSMKFKTISLLHKKNEKEKKNHYLFLHKSSREKK